MTVSDIGYVVTSEKLGEEYEACPGKNPLEPGPQYIARRLLDPPLMERHTTYARDGLTGLNNLLLIALEENGIRHLPTSGFSPFLSIRGGCANFREMLMAEGVLAIPGQLFFSSRFHQPYLCPEGHICEDNREIVVVSPPTSALAVHDFVNRTLRAKGIEIRNTYNNEDYSFKKLLYPQLQQFIDLFNEIFFKNNDTPLDNWPRDFKLEELQKAHDNKENISGIFNKEGEMIGIFWFQPREGNLHAYIGGVKRGYQDKGLSQMILTLAEQEALKCGLKKITLSVDPFNGRSIKACLKSGFKIIDYITAYFGTDYPNVVRFIMEKDLDSKQTATMNQESANDVRVKCNNKRRIRQLIKEGYIGVGLERDPNHNDRENIIVFRMPTL